MKTMATIRDICRLCLQETDPYNSRKVDMRKLCVLWKFYKFDKMDTSFYRNHIICDSCIISFKALKTMFLNAKNSQIDIIQESKRTQLSKINLKKMNRYSSIKGDFLVCRLCFKPTKEVALHLYDSPENILPVEYISKIMQACKIDMSFTKTINPVSCYSCWENIQVGYSFRKQLEIINEKINSYANALNKTVISREDLQNIFHLYNIADPTKIKAELDLLIKRESSYFCTYEDIKPKVEPESRTSETYVNTFKKVIRDGPIDDLQYKSITEDNDISNKMCTSDKSLGDSACENDKIVPNPYHNIDKVVVNPFHESEKPIKVLNFFHNADKQRVTHFDNSSQYFEDNIVYENQNLDRLNIGEDHLNEISDKISIIDDKSAPPYNIFNRTVLHIKKEIIWEDEEDIYIKKEVLSDHENDVDSVEDDIFVEENYVSERMMESDILDLDHCPSLDIKNEPTIHPEEDNTIYDIHYIEHFDQGPPLLEPQIPCVVKKPYCPTLDKKRITINKITSLNLQHFDPEWSPQSSVKVSSIKKRRGRPPKDKNLHVRNLIKEISKNTNSPEEPKSVSKINPVANKLTKTIQNNGTDIVVTRSAAKIKPKSLAKNMQVKLENKDEIFTNYKKIKKENKKLARTGFDDVKKPRKVHIFDVNAQNVLKHKFLKNISPNSNIKKNTQSTIVKKNLLNKNVSINGKIKKISKNKHIKKNPLNRYNTRSCLKNAVLNETIPKSPLNKIHTRSTIKNLALKKESAETESFNKINLREKRNISKNSILTKQSQKHGLKKEKAGSLSNNKTADVNQRNLKVSKKSHKKENKSINDMGEILKGKYSVLKLKTDMPKNTDQIVKYETDKSHYRTTNPFGKEPELNHFENEDAENKNNIKNQLRHNVLNKELIVNVPKLSIMGKVEEKKNVNKEDVLHENNIPRLDSVVDNPIDLKKPKVILATTLPKTRTREKQYFFFHCELCEFETFNERGAEMHKTKHKNNKIRTCPVCPYQTSLLACMQKHFKIAHPDQHFNVIAPDLCFYCHKKCVLQIKCKKCQNILHFGCFYKKSVSCQHEEDFFIKNEIPEHDYSLPPSTVENRSASQNPPDLQRVQPIKNLQSTSQNSPISPPLLERQLHLLETTQRDCKTIIPNHVAAVRIPNVGTKPSLEVKSPKNEPILEYKPRNVPQDQSLFENLYTDLRVENIVQNQPLTFKSDSSLTQINQPARPLPVKSMISSLAKMQSAPKRILNSTQSQHLGAKKATDLVQTRPQTGLKKVLYPVRRPQNPQSAIQNPSLLLENAKTVDLKPKINHNSGFKNLTFDRVPSDFQGVQNIVTNSQLNMDNLDLDNAIVCFDETSKQIKQEVLDSFDMS